MTEINKGIPAKRSRLAVPSKVQVFDQAVKQVVKAPLMMALGDAPRLKISRASQQHDHAM